MEGGRLDTTAGVCNAQRVIVCSGHDYQTLCAEPLRALQPQVCRLQMLRVTPEDGFRLEHAVLTGLSCTHYGAFADLATARRLATQIEQQRPGLMREAERFFILQQIDTLWREHLQAMDALRESVGLRGYGQKDPLIEYKNEGYDMFLQMMTNMRRNVIYSMFMFQPARPS